jgi:hypothetical protein
MFFPRFSHIDFVGAGFDFLAKSKPMKRWAVLTVLLYALALLILTTPVLLITFGNWGLKSSSFGIKDALALYAGWGYWLWLAVLVVGQILLLLPINITERRLPTRGLLRTHRHALGHRHRPFHDAALFRHKRVFPVR